MHLHLRDPAPHPRRHRARPQPLGHPRLPLPDQRRAEAHPGEEVVHGARRHRHARGHPPIRVHLHRDVSKGIVQKMERGRFPGWGRNFGKVYEVPIGRLMVSRFHGLQELIKVCIRVLVIFFVLELIPETVCPFIIITVNANSLHL